jgi:uncharacterized protein YoxC
MNHETIELACIAVGAGALLLQAILLLVIGLSVMKTTKSLKKDVEEMRSAVLPVVDNTRELLVRLTPKVESTVTDVAELARGMREQAAAVEATVDEVLVRVRKQTSRVDTMFSETLDAVDKASAFVTETVGKPLRQLSGMLAAAKAVVESLSSPNQPAREPAVHDDKDIFV